MATQLKGRLPPDPSATSKAASLIEAAFGLPPSETHPNLQQDVVKELVNKISWVIGSTYRVAYSNARSPARSYAWKIVQALLRDNGYPEKIGRKEDLG